MRDKVRSSLLLLALVPLILLGVLRSSPVPGTLQDEWNAVRQAQQSGSTGEFAKRLGQAAAWQPWNASLWEQAGMAAVQTQDWALAVSSFRSAEAAGKLSAAGRYWLGAAYQHAGQDVMAEQQWRLVVSTGGAGEEVYRSLVELYDRQSEYSLARDALTGWVERYPGSAEAAYNLALHEIPVSLDKAAEIMKTSAGLESEKNGAASRLRRSLEEILPLEPESYRLVQAGRALGSEGEWRAAERVFARAVELDTSYAEAMAYLGQARLKNGGNGFEELQRAVNCAPRSALARGLMALYWRNRGIPERALPHLYIAAEAEPENGFWQTELGAVLAQMGDLASGLGHYQQAVEIEPENPEYWLSLARFCINYRYELRSAGLPAARNALSLQPSSAEALDLYGWVLYNLEDRISAERFLRRSIEISPAYAEPHLHLGILHIDTGEMDKALAHLKQAVSLTTDESDIGKLARRQMKRFFGGG